MSSSGWVGIPGPYPFPYTKRSSSTPFANDSVPGMSFIPSPAETVLPFPRPPPWTTGDDAEWTRPGETQYPILPWPPQTDEPDPSLTTPEGEGPTYDSGDITFILISFALVFFMIPGLGFFYSGFSRVKSALSFIVLCFWSIAVVSIQWFIVGYSLTFSLQGSQIIGSFHHMFLLGVYDGPAPVTDKIPAILFCIYQCMFAAITPALIFGGVADRARFVPGTIFIFLWTSLVYDFLAYWTWNPNGWLVQLGGLDFAGGTPVHIASGAAALAYAIVVGKRNKTDRKHHPPHNTSAVFLGTGLLWFGWFGFNGGSALGGSSQAINACVATLLSASMGGVVWVILDYRHHRKFSPSGLCVGIVAGLVCITPACGYVSPASSLAFGSVGALCCNIAVSLKSFCSCCDDTLDVFAVHGVGGIVGNILTGVFAQKYYAPGIDGGGLDGNWFQMVYQLIDTVSGFLWSFFVSLILLFFINCIPWFRFRTPVDSDISGVDLDQYGERCYDFVEEVRTEVHKHIPIIHETPTPTTCHCQCQLAPLPYGHPILVQNQSCPACGNCSVNLNTERYTFVQIAAIKDQQQQHHQPHNNGGLTSIQMVGPVEVITKAVSDPLPVHAETPPLVVEVLEHVPEPTSAA